MKGTVQFLREALLLGKINEQDDEIEDEEMEEVGYEYVIGEPSADLLAATETYLNGDDDGEALDQALQALAEEDEDLLMFLDEISTEGIIMDVELLEDGTLRLYDAAEKGDE